MCGKHEEKNMVLSYMAMRRAVGTLGVLLPFMLIVGSIIGKCSLLPAISSFYYAPSPLNGLFIGIHCAIGVFLICYKGYERQCDERVSDDQVAYAAGIGAILIGIFPAGCACSCWDSSWFCPERLSTLLHYFGVGLFFVSTIFMLLYKFTRTYDKKKRKCFECGECDRCKEKRKRKEYRNQVYRLCAYIMSLCIILLATQLFMFKEINEYLEKISLVFWVETLAILAFGVAWFTKGEKDKECEKKKPKEENTERKDTN